MAEEKVKYHQRAKLWATYTSTVLSIAFALFLLGLIVVGGFLGYKLSNQVKENIGLKVNLVSNISDDNAKALCDTIGESEYVKSVEYISKDEAAKMFMEELGEDFVSFIGENPLYPTIVVNLKYQKIEENTAYIDQFIEEVSQNEYVTDVEYDKYVVSGLFSMFYKAAYILLALMILLLFISITLISNTIRISIYSRRFTLRTMLLVGAKKSFVMKPFIFKGMKYGVWGGLLAVIVLFGLLYYVSQKYPILINWKADMDIYITIGISLILLGIIIAFFSTYFSVRKYIKIKDEKLY